MYFQVFLINLLTKLGDYGMDGPYHINPPIGRNRPKTLPDKDTGPPIKNSPILPSLPYLLFTVIGGMYFYLSTLMKVFPRR